MNNDRSRRCHLPQKWYYMHFCRRQSADVRTANYRRIVSRPVNMSSESVRLSSSYACHLVFFRRFTTLVVRNSLALPLPPQKFTPFHKSSFLTCSFSLRTDSTGFNRCRLFSACRLLFLIFYYFFLGLVPCAISQLLSACKYTASYRTCSFY